MRSSRDKRGFTLIEAMIVVLIIGVLSLLAVVAYKRWIRTSYLAEAYDMVSNIRSAEESFRAENGVYLDVSKGLEPGYLYPATTPGAFKTQWGGPCSKCNNSNSWSSLTIEAKGGPLAFGYAVISDKHTGGFPSSVTVNGASVDLTNLTAPAYIVEAAGDIDGNGVFTKVYGFSNGSGLLVDNEGE
jgi:prepilin-type N-terminal cleavage/methylation domain-containing protein